MGTMTLQGNLVAARTCLCGDEIGPITLSLNPGATECSECSDPESKNARQVARELAAKAATNTPGPGLTPHASSRPHHEAAPPAPRAAEEHQESKGEPAQGIAGDRAGIFHCGDECEISDLRPFDALRASRSEQLSMEVEEWIYGYDAGGSPVVLRTPLEIIRVERPTPAKRLAETSSFVAVLEHRKRGSDVTLRDIGPRFTPRTSSREDRAAALNAARGWARAEASRLKAAPPCGYRPAREI